MSLYYASLNRTAFAKVTLNGRNIGMYVLKEGVSTGFLERAYGNTTGALYEGERCDLFAIQKPDHKGTAHLDLLQRFASEFTQHQSTSVIEKYVGLEYLTRFIAVEAFLGHSDGFWISTSNYRIYENPATQRLVFIPHSLDLLANHGRRVVLPKGRTVLAKALVPELSWRHSYYNTLSNLIAEPLSSEFLHQTIHTLSNAVERGNFFSGVEVETWRKSVRFFESNVIMKRKELQAGLHARAIGESLRTSTTRHGNYNQGMTIRFPSVLGQTNSKLPIRQIGFFART